MTRLAADKSDTRLTLFRRIALVAALVAFVVVVLGAWVRLSAAGLGCPDWPGCYGHLTASQAAGNLETVSQAFPERPFEYAKAAKEMLHRYIASGLGLLTLVLAGLALANRRDPRQPVALPLALVGLVIFQGLLGMWTVTLLLKPLIVVLHLLGGLTTLSLLAWLAMSKPREATAEHAEIAESRTHPRPDPSPPFSASSATSAVILKRLAAAGLAMLTLQIALGGWTSSNYAGLACPDFPTCQNEWWPPMDAGEAFVLWRGLGIDYEGGVLDHPARVAIHFVHRLGAIFAAMMLGWLSFAAWRHGPTPAVRTAGAIVAAVLITQLVLGPLMVMRALPLSLATAHNAVAALLLLSVVRLTRVIPRA